MIESNQNVCLRFLQGNDDNFDVIKNEQQLTCLQFSHREADYQHPSYQEQMRPYILLKQGSNQAITLAQAAFETSEDFQLSTDKLTNKRYQFTISTSRATQAAIEGGLNEQVAYTIQSYFIHQMDKKQTLEEIIALHQDMVTFFLLQLRQYQQTRQYSKDIQHCLIYIDQRLHTRIRLQDIADTIHLSPNYLSNRFKKELGQNLSDYIIERKITVAKNMLRFSDYSLTDITTYLAFSSQSYFSKLFKKVTRQTPKAYRQSLI